MRTDCKDLGLSTMDPPNPSPDDLRALVVKCVTRGSTMPSDFLHCSWSLQAARQWHELAREDPCRREDKSKQYLVCIDLFELYNTAKQHGEEMINDVIDHIFTILLGSIVPIEQINAYQILLALVLMAS